MRRVLLAALVAATVLAPPAPAPAQAAPNVIVAVSAVFAPGEIVVPQGTGVTFANLDEISHDVTADQGEFRSDTIQRSFTKVEGVEALGPNTYSYYCTVHPEMWGLLTVVGV